MFRIVQALNNNVALVKDEQGQQAVVMGLGIVFHKKKGDLIGSIISVVGKSTVEIMEPFLV